MIKLETKATTPEEERVKKYLEENTSEALANKIDGGAVIEKDGRQVLNLKTLSGFMKWACEEARKQAAKGASAACVDDATVFGWAIHYFEEDDIIGTLYNDDGTEYKPVKTQAVVTTAPKVKTPARQDYSGQQCMFDDLDMAEPKSEKEEKPEPEKPKISPLYESYMAVQNKYPDAVIAKRIGDFYEVFGENARILSAELDLTLTGRDCGLPERVPMIGFPYHKADVYFGKIRQNYRLVVSENDTEIVHEKYVPVSDSLVDANTGEVVEPAPQKTKQQDLFV